MNCAWVLFAMAAANSTCGVDEHKRWGEAVELQGTDGVTVLRLYMKSNGPNFPNNEDLPTLIYKGAHNGDERTGRDALLRHGWSEPWKWGIFTYHHYHTVAWEALLCVSGSALVQLGGDGGPSVQVGLGDLLLIPPGVVHKQLSSRGNFALLGSYPAASPSVDNVRATSPPTANQLRNIATAAVPQADPLFGDEQWRDMFRRH